MDRLSRKIFSSSKNRRISDSSSSSSKPLDKREDRSRSLAGHETDSSAGTKTRDASRDPSRGSQSDSLPSRSLSAGSMITTPEAQSLATIPNRSADPLGLYLQHSPSRDHSADIIFIHGLGGSSRATWTKHRHPELFWPAAWLPKDEDLERARIFTFGYNAQFKSSQASTLGITDFAKNLLYDLLFGRDAKGGALNMGQVPIVIVAHSMGGLVFKKAFLDAQLDTKYETVVTSIKAVMFLATPHRGSDLAPYLNRVLSLGIGQNSKQYVAELTGQAPFLRNINEQFRHVATNLQIFSFYETMPSSIGVSSAMVLDPESAKLGYPGEISRSMNANHYSICKFETPDDPNYKAILGALKSIVTLPPVPVNEPPNPEQMDQLRSFLSISGSTEHDFDLFCGRRAEGTCSWILDDRRVQDWLSSSPESSILRIHGRPGRGKSVIAAFLAHHLQEHDGAVSYFFFRAGDENKRTIAALIKTIALHVAEKNPAFRQVLLEMAETGYKIKDAEWRSSWKRIFVNSLFSMESYQPLYWIIDGLDEAQSPHHLFDLIGDLNVSRIPIKLLITSRWTPTLSSAFNRISAKISTSVLLIDNDLTDMQIYVRDELRYNNWDDDITEKVTSMILKRSNDNFLWVHLILDELRDCNTEEDIAERLAELPPGMDGLYRRMEETISAIRRPSDMNLSRHLLQWAIYAQRPLQAEELVDVLEPEFGRLLDIHQTLSRLCGHFVTLESDKKIGLIHQTAREYLTSTTTLPFSLKAEPSHAALFKQVMSSFMAKSMRSKLQQTKTQVYEYRATSWPYHLGACEMVDNGDEQLDVLTSFFTQESVLIWINILASLGQLKVLINASQTLSSFVRKKRRADAASDPASRRYGDLECLEGWSRDLLKILGKFGSSLSQQPDSIFTSVAPFCPSSSFIFKIFGNASPSSLTVRGLSDEWDDCLARMSIGGGSRSMATLVRCSPKYLAVGTRSGLTVLWDTTTFRRAIAVDHGEHILELCFSAKGERFATYGYRTTKIWKIDNGQLQATIPNLADMQAMSLRFVDNDAMLMMASNHSCMLRVPLSGNEHTVWNLQNAAIMVSPESVDGIHPSAPSMMAISPDGSKVAVVYRRQPLSVWSIQPTTLLRRLSRSQPVSNQVSNPLPYVSRMSWHPGGHEIIGLYMDGCNFKLNLVNGSYQEQAPPPGQLPSDIICSPDGLVYAICGAEGTIKLFDYQSSTLIYQLNSEGVINAFCFTDDGRRFCDIRSGYCSIWEPNALMRLTTLDDDPATSHAPDDSVKQSQVASEAFAETAVPVTLMSPAPRGTAVCFGDEDGVIELVDCLTSEKVRVGQTPTNISIQHLVWNENGEHFCYAEIRGRLTVMQVERDSSGKRKTRKLEKFKANTDTGDVSQLLLLANNAPEILVAARSSAQIWSLGPGKLKVEVKFDQSLKSRKWAHHPRYRDRLLSVSPTDVSIHDQTSLQKIQEWEWDRASPENEQSSDYEEKVEEVEPTYYQDYIIVKLSSSLGSQQLKDRLLIFDAAAATTETKETRIRPIELPQNVADLVEIPLNVLPNGKLVFINPSFWVCSWRLRSFGRDGGGVEDIERHFFIPRDWLPVKGQGMLHVTSSGAIFCPRKGGGLSVIESSIGSTW